MKERKIRLTEHEPDLVTYKGMRALGFLDTGCCILINRSQYEVPRHLDSGVSGIRLFGHCRECKSSET